MKSSRTAKDTSPIYKKWWFWAIIVVLVIGIADGGNEAEQPESTTPPTETASPVSVNDYSVVEKFVELYNKSSTNPVANLTKMDIQGEDYKTEFRLNSFENAIGQKGTITGGTIEVVNYGVWSNDNIRIYANADSYDSALEIIYAVIHIFDETISDNEIAENLDRSSNIVLGSGGYISGYINDSHTGVYEIMIDCSKINFME